MGSRPNQVQTVRNETHLDPNTQAWQGELLNAGRNQFNQGPAQYYPGQTVAQYSPQTLQGLSMMQGQAASGGNVWGGGGGWGGGGSPMTGSGSNEMPGGGSWDASQYGAARFGFMPEGYGGDRSSQDATGNPQNGAQHTMPMGSSGPGSFIDPSTGMPSTMGASQWGGGGGGWAPFGMAQAQQALGRGMSGYTPGMNTAQNASAGGMGSMYGDMAAGAGATPTSMGVDSLNSFAQGNLDHLGGMYDRGREQITNDLNSQFAKAGRTGANAAFGHQLGNSLGNLYSNIYAPGVEAAQDRRLSAANSLTGVDQSNRAARMQGYGMGAGVDAQNAGLRLSGAQLSNQFNAQSNQNANNAIGQLGGLYGYGSMPGQQMLGVGAAYDQQNQNNINAAMDRWNFGQNAGWQNLNNFAGVMSGMPSATSSTQTQTQPGGSRAMGALGGAATGFSVGGPWGALAGGVLGLLG